MKPETRAKILTNSLWWVGHAMLAYGLWLWSHIVALIFTGLAAIFWSIAISIMKDQEKKEKQTLDDEVKDAAARVRETLRKMESSGRNGG